MAKAELSLLEQLHAELAKTMLDELRRQRGSEDGPQASFLSTITKFLKDNHIESGVGAGDMDNIDKVLQSMGELPYDGEPPEEYKQ